MDFREIDLYNGSMRTTPISFKSVPTLNELKSGFPSVKALFFDMDGTLFNTEAFHAGALQMISKEFGIRPPHDPHTVHQLLMGKADHLIFPIVKDWENFPKHWGVKDFIEAKNKYLIEILAKENPDLYISPLIRKLLNDARQENFFIALVTSSEKIITQELLKLSKLEEYFELILTRDDCPAHKPDPWPYLKAKSISGCEHSEILIFEDSNVGLEAALASHSHVIKAEWY